MSRKRKKKFKSSGTVIVLDDTITITDEDEALITKSEPCNTDTPKKTMNPVDCSTPIAKESTSKVLCNVSENNDNTTKEINRESYLTIDLTTESDLRGNCSKSLNNTVINLADNTQDCTFVSLSNASLSISGESDVTVLEKNVKEDKKSKRKMARFANGIARLNASEKGRLLELITQNIFNGCEVPKAKKSLDNIKIPDFKSKTQILIRGDGKESKKKTKQNVNNEATKTRSESATGVTYVEPMGGKVSRKRVTPGGEVEVPMEAPLQNLALDLKSRSKSAVNQNYTKLLMQGLHSKDKDIIHTVLYKNDSVVATRTVSALPADYVPMLLERLVDMASSKTIHCASVCTWTWAVLKCHSALLLAASSSKTASHLSQLLTVFTHRRSHLCQLLNLKGRLELTMSQRSARDQLDEQEAVLQYNDTSTDEEMEIEKHHSDSDQSWDDDMDGEKSNGEHSDGERLEDDKSESGKKKLI